MAILAYQLVRAAKWLLWAGLLAYALHFLSDRASHLNHLGHLSLSSEIVLFGLPLAAIAVGMLQLYLRDLAYGDMGKEQPRR